MSKAHYDIYVDSVIALAKRMVIKNSLVALTMNRELKYLGHEVFDLYPQTWKYYLNLAGQYHSTDRMMTVTSLDTLQTIGFTIENLREHISTAREYAQQGRSFNELLSRYPDQELLIRGILHPVDIDTAVAAEDGEVLYYDPELVEENESNLIPKVSVWSRNYMQRWNNKAYMEIDDLYTAGQFAGLFMLLPTTIMNIRLANCHTRFVHSFHIREYLASHGRLEVYVDHMTKKQMLWLYRNIRFIHRNAGKQDTFEWLTQNILTDRGLPLAEWSMRHNLEDQVDNIYPRVEFARKALNFGYSSAGTDTRSIEDLLDAEQPLAPGNKRIQREAEYEIAELMENSLSDRLMTKALESSVLDTTDSAIYTLSEALLNHWVYYAHNNRYSAVVTVDNPKTGNSYTLNVKEAFLVYLYCYNVATGTQLIHLPSVIAHRVRRQPTPSFEEIRGLVQPELVDDSWIQACVQAVPAIRDQFLSTVAFNDDITAIHQGLMRQRDYYCAQEHMVARGEMEQAVLRFYEDKVCDFGETTTYTSWFAARGLDIPSLSVLECEILAQDLLIKSTGVDLKKLKSLKEMQRAMLQLMTQLSSYSIQFLQTINDDKIVTVDWPVVRVGDIDVEGFDHQNVEIIDVGVMDYDVLGGHREELDLSNASVGVTASATASHREEYDIGLVVADNAMLNVHSFVHIAFIDVLNEDFTEANIDIGVVNRSSIEYQPNDLLPFDAAFDTLLSPHYSLTEAERAELLARWMAYPSNFGVPIGTVITKRWLDGMRPHLKGLITQRWLDGLILTPKLTPLEPLPYPTITLSNYHFNLYRPSEGSYVDPNTGTRNFVLPGFVYPESLMGDMDLDGFVYPSDRPMNFGLQGFSYPAGSPWNVDP